MTVSILENLAIFVLITIDIFISQIFSCVIYNLFIYKMDVSAISRLEHVGNVQQVMRIPHSYAYTT